MTRFLAAGVVLAAVGLSSGCASFGLKKAEADPTILTGAVPGAPVDSGKASDQITIRNAVSSANIGALAGAPIAWANVDTDSRGAIFDIVETGNRGEPCRSFKATRESFMGVSLFRGEACMAGPGAWYLRIFREG